MFSKTFGTLVTYGLEKTLFFKVFRTRVENSLKTSIYGQTSRQKDRQTDERTDEQDSQCGF